MCVCECDAWVYMHPHTHRSKAFIFASTTFSWTLVVSWSPFHTEIPENTRVMCSGICSRIIRFAAFTLPVIFWNMCVHSHTTRKDPVKTLTFHVTCIMRAHHFTKLENDFSFSADSEELPDCCFILVYTFSSCERWSAFKNPVKQLNDKVRHHYHTLVTALIRLFVHTALVPGLKPGNVTRSQPGINPGTCLRSHRRHTIFRTNVQCEKGFTFILPHSLSMAGHFWQVWLCAICTK